MRFLMWFLALVFGLFMTFNLLAGHVAKADEAWIQGRVVGVTDGDTATVLDKDNHQYEIRLFAIDAPETTCHQKRPSIQDDLCVDQGQPFAKASKKNLARLIYDKQVSVRTGQGRSYDRVVGTIYVQGVDVNLQQVRDGYAWHYKYFARNQTQQDQTIYSNGELAAQAEKRGLWVDNNPIAPWEYRKLYRN